MLQELSRNFTTRTRRVKNMEQYKRVKTTTDSPQIEITSVVENSDRPRRLLQRKAPFHQSNGIWNVKNLWSNNLSGNPSWEFYKLDPFHVLVNGSRASIPALIFMVFLVYMFFTIIFALFYLLVSGGCGLPDMNLLGAMIFSVETMMTIGYGVPGNDDALFRDCRRHTRLFSDKAVIRKIKGHYYFMFRVSELTSQQLVEAHVRCYAIRHSKDFMGSGHSALFQNYHMRLCHPDDELGGMLMMALPSFVVHRVDDPWSPLCPPSLSKKKKNKKSFEMDDDERMKQYCFPEIQQRAADAEAGCRDGVSCFTCGESFETLGMLRKHGKFYETVENPGTAHPILRGGGSIDDDQEEEEELSRGVIESFMRTSELEVIAIVEGIEPATSDTIQARHSYTADEIVWDHTFLPCLTRTSSGCCVDYSRFHKIVPCIVDDEEEEKKYDGGGDE